MCEPTVGLIWWGTGGAAWPVDPLPSYGGVARIMAPVIGNRLDKTQQATWSVVRRKLKPTAILHSVDNALL